MYMYPKVSTVTKFDYRQELGILVQNCPILAQDAGKLFDVYWDLSHGKTAKIPKKWNPSLRFDISHNFVVIFKHTRIFEFFLDFMYKMIILSQCVFCAIDLKIEFWARKFKYFIDLCL